MGRYNIKDLQQLTGIKAHTIRIWEKRYHLLEPNRTDTNIRTYSDEDLKKLLNISILNHQGIKISHLANLSNKEIHDKVRSVTMNPDDTHAQIESLLLAMINLDEPKIHEIINQAIMVNGFEWTFIEIIMKTLIQVGVLWQTGTITPAQEHFISNLIRQKLIANIDSLNPPVHPKSKRFILFLPEGEMHELSLLFASYLIKKRGNNILYFGQQTPFSSVIEAEKVWPADVIVIALVSSISGIILEEFASKVYDAFPEKTIILFGNQAKDLTSTQYPNIKILNNVGEFNLHLDALSR